MIVLDASALLDVLIDQPAKQWVLAQIAANEVVAPAHQPAEILSALARLVRAEHLSVLHAREAAAEAAGLAQKLIVPTRQHLERSLELQDRVRVLDGLYVALAEEYAAPLVTTDLKLARAGMAITTLTP